MHGVKLDLSLGKQELRVPIVSAQEVTKSTRFPVLAAGRAPTEARSAQSPGDATPGLGFCGRALATGPNRKSPDLAPPETSLLAFPMPRFFRLTLALCAALFASVLFAAPEKWTTAIDTFTQADAAHPPAPGGVVFVGSSSIVKWTTLAQDFPGVPVIQRGFGGSDLSDSVFFADRIVTPYKPRVVVVYAGENDLWAGKSADALLADFKAFNQKVHAAVPAARIVFIGLKPSPSRIRIRAEVLRANGLIAAECAKDKRLVFVDVFGPMLDAQGKDRPELYVDDQLHMKPAGYAIWTPLVAKAIK